MILGVGRWALDISIANVSPSGLRIGPFALRLREGVGRWAGHEILMGFGSNIDSEGVGRWALGVEHRPPRGRWALGAVFSPPSFPFPVSYTHLTLPTKRIV